MKLAVLLVCLSFGSQANQTALTMNDFVAAYQASMQPNAKEQLARVFTDMFSEDVVDVHVAYNVTVKGNDKMRNNILAYNKRMKTYKAQGELVHWNNYFAALILKESSSYLKQGKLKEYNGNTFLVMEFNDVGKIKHIRRYHQ